MENISRSEFSDLKNTVGKHSKQIFDLQVAENRTNESLVAVSVHIEELRKIVSGSATKNDVRDDGRKTRKYVVVGGLIGTVLTLTLFFLAWFHV